MSIAEATDSLATAHGHRRSIAGRIVAAVDMTNVPWNLPLCAALGVWLMAAPAVLGTSGAAADVDHLAGALVVTWAVIAFGEIVRPARLLNVLMGMGVVAAPWLLAGDTEFSRWNCDCWRRARGPQRAPWARRGAFWRMELILGLVAGSRTSLKGDAMTRDTKKPTRNRDQELPPRKGDTIGAPEPITTPEHGQGNRERDRNAPLPEEETYEREAGTRRRDNQK